jgi:broad specificity phosphatase PhoE
MNEDRIAVPGRITFITHAATREQKSGIFPAGEVLEEATVENLTTLRWESPKVLRVWASPEVRVQQTAIALGLNAVEAHELRECDFGAWAGRSLEQIYSEDSAGTSLWLADLGAAPHGGESYRQLIGRAGAWLDEQQGTGHAIVVTHASVVRAAILHALNVPEEAFRRIEVAPLTATDLRWNGKGWHLRSAGVSLASSTNLADSM